ncbi:ethanolamine utilization protein EutA [Tindallia magadiensis]|uniref:Ethanolamine utilization protein EutA n=1 Tax=Tindallia magadiensis TaxID=69895 RepID=A0A1I3BUP5_9FIRM|nr:ethanolamine ammonia-lyase reactivating factor EutA [Tindallia magadiensis]SFH65972.1 ethanolamine utilization protein EutA [Tindallia magadiensis]
MAQQLKSVGIDVGTSTTQLVFSRITVENTAAAWTVPTVQITHKEVIYRSEIYFTPLISAEVIDAAALKDIVAREYQQGKMKPEEVDTGAIIITGETARKENAEQVLTMLSGFAGDFVVATAGPDLEGVLAGKGSGACDYSKEHNATVMNLDIGGGTTNVAVFQNGKLIDTACYDIGGRLIQFSEDQHITYISQKAEALIKHLGLEIALGKKPSMSALKQFCQGMAETIVEIMNADTLSPIQELLITDHGLRKNHSIDKAFLSGGVADCVASANPEEDDWLRYGDIGILLGNAIAQSASKTKHQILYGSETIGATVVGAGNHSTDVSGSTVHYDGELLPLKNIPLIKLDEEEEALPSADRQQKMSEKMEWIQQQGDTSLVALGIRGQRGYGFNEIQALAKDIAMVSEKINGSDHPLIVILESDFGKSLGLCLRSMIPKGQGLICIDSINADNGDYIDIGVPVAQGQVVPIVIKTLLFGY